MMKLEAAVALILIVARGRRPAVLVISSAVCYFSANSRVAQKVQQKDFDLCTYNTFGPRIGASFVPVCGVMKDGAH